jgi:hypothetical protein
MLRDPAKLTSFFFFMCFYFTAVRQASRQAKTFRKKKGKLRPCRPAGRYIKKKGGRVLFIFCLPSVLLFFF